MKKIILVLFLGLFSLGLVACGDEENVAAIVNNEEIEMEEYEKRLESTKQMYEQQGISIAEQGEEFEKLLSEQVINSIIDETLLIQASKDIEVSEEEVEAELELIKANYETDEEYQDILEKNDLTEIEIKELVKEQLKVQSYMAEHTEEIKITEEELNEIFEEYKGMMEEEVDLEEVKPYLQDVLIKQKQQEQQVKLVEELRANADIEVLI